MEQMKKKTNQIQISVNGISNSMCSKTTKCLGKLEKNCIKIVIHNRNRMTNTDYVFTSNQTFFFVCIDYFHRFLSTSLRLPDS